MPFQDITLEEWQRTLDVNLTGTFHCIQAAIGDMVAGRWGRIVTISSAAGQTASPRQAHYSASKGGVIAMTKTIAAEFAPQGHHRQHRPAVHRRHPDAPRRPGGRPPARRPRCSPGMVPAGRLGTVDDIGAACAFLCSEDAGYITGQVIAPNGGAVI